MHENFIYGLILSRIYKIKFWPIKDRHVCFISNSTKSVLMPYDVNRIHSWTQAIGFVM